MIKILNLADNKVAQRILIIQRLAYRIEAELIGFDGIPALHETIDDLKNSEEVFAGFFIEDALAGVISYSIKENVLDIGRLVIHPDYFRRGIARSLVGYVESIENVSRIVVSTGKDNHPARTLYERLAYQFVEHVVLPEGVSISCYEKEI